MRGAEEVIDTDLEYDEFIELYGPIPYVLSDCSQVFMDIFDDNFSRFARQDLFENISVGRLLKGILFDKRIGYSL